MANPGDILVLYVTGTGGGNQLYNQTYLGSDLINGNTAIIPFGLPTSTPPLPGTIYEFVIYNGEHLLTPGVDYTYASAGEHQTAVTFTQTYDATNRINLSTLGYTGNGTANGWSLPVFETLIADASIVASQAITLTNSMQGTNPVNLIVSVNGQRIEPSQGARYIGDGTQKIFNLPRHGRYNQGLVSNNDVEVFVNGTALILGVDFVLNAFTTPPRAVTIFTAPPAGSIVLISVRTIANYWVVGNQLTFENGFTVADGDIIEVTSWNDTTEQDILTQVFVGPVNGANVFDTGRPIANPERLLVTLDGNWLFNGLGFIVDGSAVVIPGTLINTNSVLTITSFTQYLSLIHI